MKPQEMSTPLPATGLKATVAGSGRALRGTDPHRVLSAVAGTCILLVWVFFSFYLLIGAVAQGARERVEQASSGDGGMGAGAGGGTGTRVSGVNPRLPIFYQLMAEAREVCPAGRDLLLLGDERAAYELAVYYMYPRRVVFIGLDQPFGPDDMASQAGGCVANYGPVSGGRLEQYSPMLDQLRCARSECLYIVNRSTR
jgi:hypothetical protein